MKSRAWSYFSKTSGECRSTYRSVMHAFSLAASGRPRKVLAIITFFFQSSTQHRCGPQGTPKGTETNYRIYRWSRWSILYLGVGVDFQQWRSSHAVWPSGETGATIPIQWKQERNWRVQRTVIFIFTQEQQMGQWCPNSLRDLHPWLLEILNPLADMRWDPNHVEEIFS